LQLRNPTNRMHSPILSLFLSETFCFAKVLEARATRIHPYSKVHWMSESAKAKTVCSWKQSRVFKCHNNTRLLHLVLSAQAQNTRHLHGYKLFKTALCNKQFFLFIYSDIPAGIESCTLYSIIAGCVF
jgi:hypothetical protein